MAYKGFVDIGKIQAALAAGQGFSESLRSWDESARRNEALASNLRATREAEALRRASLPQYLAEDVGGGQRASGGGRRGSTASALAASQSVSLSDALAAIAEENQAIQAGREAAIRDVAAAQATRGRRNLFTQGPAYLRQRQEMAALEGPRETLRDPGAPRLTLSDIESLSRDSAPAIPELSEMDRLALIEALSGQFDPVGAALEDEAVLSSAVSGRPGDVASREISPGYAARIRRGAAEARSPVGGDPESIASVEMTPEYRELARAAARPAAEQRPPLPSGASRGLPRSPLDAAVSPRGESVDPSATEPAPVSDISQALGQLPEQVEVGPLASELMGLSSDVSVEEAKARVAEANRKKKLKNPIAEFSRVVDETYLPSMQRLDYAVGLAKGGDRSLISSIMGRSVNRSEVSELDRVVANYRDYAKGVRLKADEIRTSREADALEKESAKGDLFADLVRGDLAKMKPGLDEVAVDELADSLGKMSVYDPQGARSMLSLYKGMRDTELQQEAAKKEAARRRREAMVKRSPGNKQLISIWKEQSDNWREASSRVSDLTSQLDEMNKKAKAPVGDLDGDGTADTEADKQIRNKQVLNLRGLLFRASEAERAALEQRDRAYQLVAKDYESLGLVPPPVDDVDDGQGGAAVLNEINKIFKDQASKRIAEGVRGGKSEETLWSNWETKVAAMLQSKGMDPGLASGIVESHKAGYARPDAEDTVASLEEIIARPPATAEEAVEQRMARERLPRAKEEVRKRNIRDRAQAAQEMASSIVSARRRGAAVDDSRTNEAVKSVERAIKELQAYQDRESAGGYRKTPLLPGDGRPVSDRLRELYVLSYSLKGEPIPRSLTR